MLFCFIKRELGVDGFNYTALEVEEGAAKYNYWELGGNSLLSVWEIEFLSLDFSIHSSSINELVFIFLLKND